MSTRQPTIPEGLDLVPAADGAVIRKTWLSWSVLPLAIFVVVWDSFLFFWYSNALAKSNIPWIMIVFPIGHVAVGVGLTYYVIASLFNKTDVIVTLSGVQVRTYPAPWPGNKNVGAGDITDVIVRERARPRRGGHSVTYSVMYAGQSRKERKLISVSQLDQAEYIANAIRAALNLPGENS